MPNPYRSEHKNRGAELFGMGDDHQFKEINELTKQIIGAAMEVHRTMGPGLLESAYEACLAYELSSRSLHFEQQRSLPISYKDVHLDCGYRLDIVVEEKVVIELKAVDTILPIHHAQLLTYLKLSGFKIGLLINFNVKLLKDGIKRILL